MGIAGKKRTLLKLTDFFKIFGACFLRHILAHFSMNINVNLFSMSILQILHQIFLNLIVQKLFVKSFYEPEIEKNA
jgi:hypothetical protein